MTKYPDSLINWLACGERGLSSNTIVEVPSLRNDLSKMKEVSAQWKNLIDNWELLEETLKFELTRSDGKAPKLYRLMKELEL